MTPPTVSAAASLPTSLAMPHLPSIRGLPILGKRVLLRIDANVPLSPRGHMLDDWRLRAIIPTIKALTAQGGRVGILTHLGRPGGRVVPRLSTRPLAEHLSSLLGKPVEFVPDCVGRVAEYAMESLPPGQVVMFENTRFHPGEGQNQAAFVRQLAALGDMFVNDAFATAHRSHASTAGLGDFMKLKAAGPLVHQELAWAQKVMTPEKGPVVAILAGSLVAPKMDLMRNLLERVDTIVLGGAVANTFLAARDLGLGHSLLEPTLVATARELMAEAGVVGCRLHLPQDVMVADLANPKQASASKGVQELEANDIANDIGPQTIATWTRLLSEAGSVLWFGGVGMMESPDFAAGTVELAKTLAKGNAFSLVAGDGLVRLLGRKNLRDTLPAVSTGGVALMQLVQGNPLPALDALC